eukprot:737928_1
MNVSANFKDQDAKNALYPSTFACVSHSLLTCSSSFNINTSIAAHDLCALSSFSKDRSPFWAAIWKSFQTSQLIHVGDGKFNDVNIADNIKRSDGDNIFLPAVNATGQNNPDKHASEDNFSFSDTGMHADCCNEKGADFRESMYGQDEFLMYFL